MRGKTLTLQDVVDLAGFITPSSAISSAGVDANRIIVSLALKDFSMEAIEAARIMSAAYRGLPMLSDHGKLNGRPYGPREV